MLFEILGLLIAVGGIVTLARGRGASPVVAGSVAVVGWLYIKLAGGMVFPSADAQVWIIVASWGWIGAVALFLRFAVGARRAKPDGKWNCSDCRYLNNSSSVVCEACGRPWKAVGETSQSAGA